MLVPDASAVLTALTVDGDAGEAARTTLTDSGPLHAPHVLDLEVLSGLRGLLMGQKLTARRADQSRHDFWGLAITRHPHRALAERVWQLRHNLSVYDAAYVALAEVLDAPLLTADAAMRDAPGVACAVEVVANG
jgi:predicted nucleic acid-binding protein